MYGGGRNERSEHTDLRFLCNRHCMAHIHYRPWLYRQATTMGK
ncbi:hypothetical protein BIFDEN_01224 [Bifidobacterium dentium ATCC 27678]|nr:hypothetical protein BIFDEN_01224 [Bifidobacterium dentium ATCC 27678]